VRGEIVMPTFTYGKSQLEYSLYYEESRKDLSISVEWLDGVKVFVPKDFPENELNKILYNKATWILSKWRELQEITTAPPPKEFVSGEKLPYLGRFYRLKVDKTYAEVASLQFKQGKFYYSNPAQFDNEARVKNGIALYRDWLKTHGEQKIQERVALYEKKMGVTPNKVEIKEQKFRWGTCTPAGNIYLNWRIVMAPLKIIDYLLVHEMAHLKYPNHSKDFWKVVHSILPDYEERKEWLRINGPTLQI
jgi:predicted metal-dependent hydrolase